MNKDISLQFNDLQNEWLIEKDTIVTIINNKGSITIRESGIAMESANFMDRLIVKNIKSGEFLSAQNVRSIRPGYGMHPKYYSQILGKVASRNIEKGTALKWEHISK